MTSYDFAISGQHYLFDVQSFAHTILAAGGDAFSYALLDRTTQGVIDDVASGAAELGVIMQTSETESALNEALAEAGLAFHELAVSAPLVALPSSHPFREREDPHPRAAGRLSLRVLRPGRGRAHCLLRGGALAGAARQEGGLH